MSIRGDLLRSHLRVRWASGVPLLVAAVAPERKALFCPRLCALVSLCEPPLLSVRPTWRALRLCVSPSLLFPAAPIMSSLPINVPHSSPVRSLGFRASGVPLLRCVVASLREPLLFFRVFRVFRGSRLPQGRPGTQGRLAAQPTAPLFPRLCFFVPLCEPFFS